MSDRAWGRLRIGGSVPYESLKAAVAEHLGQDLPDDPADIPMKEDVHQHGFDMEDGFLMLEDPDVVGGCFEDFEQWLCRNGIAFDRVNAPYPGVWSDEKCSFRPGMDSPYTTISDTHNGHFYAEICQVRKAAKKATTIEEFRAWVDGNHPEIPPLEPVNFV